MKLICRFCFHQAQRKEQEAILRRQIEGDKARAQHIQERLDYFEAIARLPLAARLLAIGADKGISQEYLRYEGYVCSPYSRLVSRDGPPPINEAWLRRWGNFELAEFETFDAETTQRLLDLSEDSYVLGQLGVRKPLYDRRHQLRTLAIAEVRATLAGLSPREQLTKLVVNSGTPLMHFPVELAGTVTQDWLASLPMESRARFLRELAKCKLRAWVKVRRRLGPYAAADE